MTLLRSFTALALIATTLTLFYLSKPDYRLQPAAIFLPNSTRIITTSGHYGQQLGYINLETRLSPNRQAAERRARDAVLAIAKAHGAHAIQLDMAAEYPAMNVFVVRAKAIGEESAS